SRHGIEAQERADQLGADGSGADQRGRHRDYLSSAASACCSANGGFHLESGRTKNPGGFAIRQSGKRLRLQALVSRGGTQHGAIRQRSDEVAESVKGARKKVMFKSFKSSENWAVVRFGKDLSLRSR